MSSIQRLADKIAIVTGASSGIGAETARQFAAHGAKVVVCDVNSIHPGFVETPMTRDAHSNNTVAQQRLDATPLGRFGTPYDIAMGCVYLASDEAAWITGAELVIDGGMVAN